MFGVGNLGGALMHDNGLEQFGLKIVAGFDVKYELAGTSINRIPIHHIEKFPELPATDRCYHWYFDRSCRQGAEVSELMIQGGIRAIWNFTPFRIRVPENVVVQNTSIYAHLAVMFQSLECHN